MNARITIDPDVLAAQSREVKRIADQVDQARDAAATMSAGSFGAVGFELAIAFQMFTSSLQGMITSAEVLLHETAAQLDGTIDDFSAVEDAAQLMLKSYEQGVASQWDRTWPW
jgi:hypothetical protein